MNEAETRAELNDPALKDAGWGVLALAELKQSLLQRAFAGEL